jgi:hypothetical protein
MEDEAMDLDRIADRLFFGLIAAFLALCAAAAAFGSEQDFSPAPPIVRRPPPGAPAILGDAYARLLDAERHRDPLDPRDAVTLTHECCHGVSALADVVNGARHSRHSIYVGDGKVISIRHPRVTIRDVAAAIPKADRSGPFSVMAKTYLVDQAADWNERPVYLVEEWVGYTHGAIYRQAAGIEDRSDTVWRAQVFERWVRVFAGLARKRDPLAPDLDKLERFIEWNAARLPSDGG